MKEQLGLIAIVVLLSTYLGFCVHHWVTQARKAKALRVATLEFKDGKRSMEDLKTAMKDGPRDPWNWDRWDAILTMDRQLADQARTAVDDAVKGKQDIGKARDMVYRAHLLIGAEKEDLLGRLRLAESRKLAQE